MSARISATAQNTADIAAIRADVAALTSTIAAFIATQTPATVAAEVVSAPEPKATPDFIVRRAANKGVNRALAGLLRAAALEPKGAVWEAAKAAEAAGKTPRQIVAAARKAA